MKYAFASILFVISQMLTLSVFAQTKLPNDIVEEGDYIFVMTGIVGCGNRRYVVEYVKAESQQTANFLDRYDLQVIGSTVTKIQDSIISRIYEDTGREPETVRLFVVPPTDEEAVFRFLKAVVKFRNTELNCNDREEEKPVRPYIDWPKWDDYANLSCPSDIFCNHHSSTSPTNDDSTRPFMAKGLAEYLPPDFSTSFSCCSFCNASSTSKYKLQSHFRENQS